MRNFQGQKFISRVNFETAKHHRQVLRQQIKPQLFQKLQVSDNPAANYINAYRNIYKDELQKTMQQHYNKKAKDQNQTLTDKVAYSLNPITQSRFKLQELANQSMSQQHQQAQQYQYNQLQHSTSVPQLSQKGQSLPITQMNNSSSYANYQNQNGMQSGRFRDYFEERTNKFQNHIKNNFDGGQQFFKIQDAYHEKRVKQTQNYADFLKKQLQQKQYTKMTQRQKQNLQQNALRQMQSYQAQLDKQKFMKQAEMKNYQNLIQAQEVQLQRERRHRKSKQFQYNNFTLHNPITNPIEYHIDNPYILKKIQDKLV